MGYHIYVFQGDDKSKYIARITYIVRICDMVFDHYPSKNEIGLEYNQTKLMGLFPPMTMEAKIEYEDNMS